MASFGHVAVGMLTGRLHGGGRGDGKADEGPPKERRRVSWGTLLVFAVLAVLPDADVLLVALGACDNGVCGHRGFSHSFPFAIAIGILGGLMARRLRWPVLRTTVATIVAVGSHAVLDLLAADGRGLPLLWPFSDHRFTSPVRLLADAPRGMALLSWHGVVNVAIELVLFSPVVIYSLWPRLAAWFAARSLSRRIAPLPHLAFEAPTPSPTAVTEADPPVRSAG